MSKRKRRKKPSVPVNQMSAEEYQLWISGKGSKKKRKQPDEPYNKYHSHQSDEDGITFDSQTERRRYLDLKMLLNAGAIHSLEIHPRYPFRGVRTKLLLATYVADFAYVVTETGEWVVEDTKSEATRTQSYRKNVKMMYEWYGIVVTESLWDRREKDWIIRPSFALPKKLAAQYSPPIVDGTRSPD